MGKFIDITGSRYGELTVIDRAEIKIKNRPAWRCLCDCGEERITAGDALKCGDVKCCGKHKTTFYTESLSERSKIQNRKYPRGVDSHSRLYTLWRAMLWRCNDPSHEAYGRYGAIGIKVCPSWNVYAGFMAWAVSSGYKDDLTIDRIDNDKGYESTNCRWATPKAQAHNRKRGLILIEAFGEQKPVVAWVADPRCRITLGNLRKRLAAGHPPEFALTATEHETRVAAQAKR